MELSCVLGVSTDYLLMGKEPHLEKKKDQLLDIIGQLSEMARNMTLSNVSRLKPLRREPGSVCGRMYSRSGITVSPDIGLLRIVSEMLPVRQLP